MRKGCGSQMEWFGIVELHGGLFVMKRRDDIMYPLRCASAIQYFFEAIKMTRL